MTLSRNPPRQRLAKIQSEISRRWRPIPTMALSIAAFALALPACDDDEFDPITKITAPRVLAVTSEPTVLAVDGDVRLTAFSVDPRGPRSHLAALDATERPVDAVRMRACTPWKLLADPARDCAGADAFPLSADADGRFALTTSDLIAAFPPPPDGPLGGAPATPKTLRLALAAGLELRIPVIAEVDLEGETLVARRDLHLAEEVGDLQNPRPTELRFDGAPLQTLRAGQRYRLTLAFDGQSLDPSDRRDNPDPDRLEELDCNFYSPTGLLAEREVDVERTDEPFPETAPNAYTAGEPGPTWIYVVATDETGGMSVASVRLLVE